MSFHDPQSEVSRLNRFAEDTRVSVSPATYHVLTRAKELYERTRGLFDITVAAELIEGGLLPRHAFLSRFQDYGGSMEDIELLSGGQVHFARPLCIDLGGIAKGFAVDQAVQVLQEKGIRNGLVNAGGDMRCFGPKEQAVWVKHPRNPAQLLPLPALKNRALATSANSYEGPHPSVCPQIHGQMRKPLRRAFSVSVCADCCLIADALTKVVLALEQESTEILSEFNAAGFIVYPDNRVMCCEEKEGLYAKKK